MTSETSSKEIERYVTVSNLLSPRQVSVDLFGRTPKEIREFNDKKVTVRFERRKYEK